MRNTAETIVNIYAPVGNSEYAIYICTRNAFLFEFQHPRSFV